MIWAVAVAAGALVASGVYLALARDALRTVVGVSLLGAGVNLVLLSAGRLGAAQPPFVPEGAVAVAAGAANPLPQALVLTAIVIGFALTCFALVLVLAIWQRTAIADHTRLQAAEPPPDANGLPPVLDHER